MRQNREGDGNGERAGLGGRRAVRGEGELSRDAIFVERKEAFWGGREVFFFFFFPRVLVLQRVSDGLGNQFSSAFRRRRKKREVPNSGQKQMRWGSPGTCCTPKGLSGFPLSRQLVLPSIFAILY